MNLETLPLLLAAALALLGTALLIDALVPQAVPQRPNLRRRPRPELAQTGEVVLSLALWLMAFGLASGDRGRYGTLCFVLAVPGLLYAALSQRAYLASWLSARGPARRRRQAPLAWQRDGRRADDRRLDRWRFSRHRQAVPVRAPAPGGPLV